MIETLCEIVTSTKMQNWGMHKDIFTLVTGLDRKVFDTLLINNHAIVNRYHNHLHALSVTRESLKILFWGIKGQMGGSAIRALYVTHAGEWSSILRAGSTSFIKEIREREVILSLYLAAFFHDYNHLGSMSASDTENIAVAKVAVHTFFAEHGPSLGLNRPDGASVDEIRDFVISLIGCTEYPFKQGSARTILHKILRDADILASLGSSREEFSTNILNDLFWEIAHKKEHIFKEHISMKRDFLNWEISFLLEHSFFTVEANAIVGDLKDEAIDLCKNLVKSSDTILAYIEKKDLMYRSSMKD